MRQLAKQLLLASFLVLGTTVVGPTVTAQAQVVRIGVDIAAFPRMVAVPGYPVYYAPDVRANYFFYDGLFWVFNVDDGYWYSSSWYNGPWVVVEPDYVPQPILVVPYRYYHVRPAYWGGWAYDRPPRWDVYWGPRWVEHHRDWHRWDRSRRWTAAPLPVYQRDFPRDRYPSPDRQVTIYRERYNYKPRDVVVRDRERTIIERQARGGERAHARADFIERGPREGSREGQLREQQHDQRQAIDRANNQRREDLRQQDRARRESNNQAERAQRQSDNQRREDLRQQDRAADQANRQRQEDLRQQDKARRESNNQAERAQRQSADQANRQRQEDLKQQDKARRESNSQAERAQRQSAVQQDRAQRQANVQENRQRQEAARQQDKAQRQANVQQERSQRQANVQAERAQHQAAAQQDRAQRQATQQERGREKDKGERG